LLGNWATADYSCHSTLDHANGLDDVQYCSRLPRSARFLGLHVSVHVSTLASWRRLEAASGTVPPPSRMIVARRPRPYRPCP
jgi:hypothetical protein